MWWLICAYFSGSEKKDGGKKKDGKKEKKEKGYKMFDEASDESSLAGEELKYVHLLSVSHLKMNI